MFSFPTKSCLGVNVVDIDYESFITKSIEWKKESKSLNIMSINLTALKRYNNEFQFFIDQFDITTADGKGLVIFSRLLGEKIYNHLSIPRICDRYIRQFVNDKKNIFLLGAKKKINDKAVENLINLFPTINIQGHHGYFNLDDMDEIIDVIKNFTPDLILVGISSPMKEQVILKLSKKYKRSINIACGGYIDILSGEVAKAPILFHITGMEWLYRFYQEPKRMFGPMVLNAFFFLFYIMPKAILEKYIKRRAPRILDIMNNYNNA